MVGDVDSLQGLYVRGLAPPLVALVVGAGCVGVTAAFLPAAAAILAVGLVLAGALVPVLTAALSRAAGRRQTAARAELTAELVELLRGAPELVVYGREDDTLERIHARSDELARLGRRDALAAGLGGGPLDPRRRPDGRRRARGRLAYARALDRVLVATLALLALASFESVAPLQAAARELSATIAAGRRVFELVDREPAVRDPAEPRLPPPLPAAVALEGVTARYEPGEPPALSGFDLRLEPGRKVALVGPSGAGKTTVTNLLLRFLDPEEGRVTLAGRDVRELPSARPAEHLRARRPERPRLQLDDPGEPQPRPPGRDRRRARGRPPIAPGSATGSPRSRTGSRRWSARKGRSSPAASASA